MLNHLLPRLLITQLYNNFFIDYFLIFETCGFMQNALAQLLQ